MGTTRGCNKEDFEKIGEFLDRCCTIALKVQKEKGKKLAEFEKGLTDDNKDLVAARRCRGMGNQVWIPRHLVLGTFQIFQWKAFPLLSCRESRVRTCSVMGGNQTTIVCAN